MTWLKNFRALIFWTVLTLILVLLPGTSLPQIPDFHHLFKPDKIIHLFLFGTFSFLILQGIIKQYSYVFFRYYGIIIALFAGVSWGAITEYLQYILEINRSGNIYDTIANTLGCLIGILVFFIARRKKLRKANAQLRKT